MAQSPLSELGWDAGQFPQPVVTGLLEPIDTWVDMSQMTELESWGNTQVKSVAYFCGPLPGACEDDPLVATRQVRERARQFARTDLRDVWPNGCLDDLLVAPDEYVGDARFDAQHWRANVTGSERYVLSRPGSTKWRLRADSSGFANLYLAGDWTRSGLNLGCAEAAIMSGMQAAGGIVRHDPKHKPVTVWGDSDT